MPGIVLNLGIIKSIFRSLAVVALPWVLFVIALASIGTVRAQDPSDDVDSDLFLDDETSEAPATAQESTETADTAPSQSDNQMQAESSEAQEPMPESTDEAYPDKAPTLSESDEPIDEPNSESKEADEDVKVDLGGGFILYFYQPLEGDGENFFEVFEARLRLDAEFDIFAIHVAPVFRDTIERGFFPSTTWIEEAYAAVNLAPVTIKLGKVYRQFGKFWDNSFYGNVQEYDGLKLDPNHGISLEGNIAEEDPIGLKFYVQFFVIDGTTNYSLNGRDTHSIPDAHRRNQIVGRVAPFFKIGDSSVITVGVSGEFFQADLPIGVQDVTRVAGDVTASLYGFSIWGEFTKQFGRHIINFPIAPTLDDAGVETAPGQSSDSVTYMMVGGEYTYAPFTIRYNFNLGDYGGVDYKEMRHIPGLSVSLHKYLSVLLEYAYATKDTAGVSETLDSSINVTIHGKI